MGFVNSSYSSFLYIICICIYILFIGYCALKYACHSLKTITNLSIKGLVWSDTLTKASSVYRQIDKDIKCSCSVISISKNYELDVLLGMN